MTAPTVAVDVQQVWDSLRYHPHVAQRKLHASYARHRVNAAGRRMGKSTAAAREGMLRVMEAYGSKNTLDELGVRYEGWITGPNYTDGEKVFRTLYNDCRRLGIPFDKPGTYYTKLDMSVSLFHGTFLLHVKSGAHPESLVGEGLHFAIMTEGAKMKESVWERFIRPTLADFEGESWWDSTPEGRNWFYRLYRAGQDPENSEWASWRHPSWLNRNVYKHKTKRADVAKLKELIAQGYTSKDWLMRQGLEVDGEIVSMAVDLTPEAFGQEIECNFSDMVGRVFKDWDEDVHVRDLPYVPGWPLFLATDYGYTDPNVCLFIQVSPHGDVRIIAEYYRTQRTDTQFRDDVLADERLARLVPLAAYLFPDPEDPGATKTLSEGWKVQALGGTGGPLMDRVRAIQGAMKQRNRHLPWGHPERAPQLLVDRSCTELIREMDAYSWPRLRKAGMRGPELPQDKDNHAPEALGRFFAGYGAGQLGPVVSKVNFGRGRRR
jgi:hypothetical protein